MIDIPKQVKIGPYWFKIKALNTVEDKIEYFGECNTTTQTITIETNQQPMIVLDSLIHEINHAIWWLFQLEDTDVEEKIVSVMATGWTMVYGDNPELLRWIVGVKV